MASNNQSLSRGQSIGLVLFSLALVFCSMSMVPGWGVDLGWHPLLFVAIMAVAGAVGGLLMATEHRLPGLIGGLVGGPGSLLATAVVLFYSTWTHSVILVLVGFVGCIPGIVLYLLLAALQDHLLPPNQPLSRNRFRREEEDEDDVPLTQRLRPTRAADDQPPPAPRRRSAEGSRDITVRRDEIERRE